MQLLLLSAEHCNLARQQEVIEERGHDDGHGENIGHIGLHPRKHDIGKHIESFCHLQHGMRES